MKAQAHNLPPRYQHIGNGRYYVNFNIEQVNMDMGEGDPVLMYMYDSVLVDRLTRDNVISAIIRDRYSIDQVEAITNNYLDGYNAIDWLKLQNYRSYAKAIADNAEQTVIDAHKTAKVFAVELPLTAVMPGQPYNDLANKMLMLKVPFILDQLNNRTTVYPGWISDTDRGVLENDTQVTITETSIF